TSVKKGERKRKPSPPFITSTLQQEASRRLSYSPKRTMMLAQQLYEGVALGGGEAVGLITYMRTDSTHLAEGAVQEAREHIGQAFGKEYVPREPRVYKTKVKGAQEAHEAIRPTAVSRTPEAIGRYLSQDQRRLYTLVWQRMVACQMADALYDTVTVEIEARQVSGNGYRLRASATQLRFPGYRRLYTEADEEKEKEEEAEAGRLPELAAGDGLGLLDLYPQQHFTEPPPRYSEASLIKALEEKGVGRPSTYAPTIGTVQDRGYVEKLEGRLRPTELGCLVNDLLQAHFPAIIDITFTAQMEEGLDEIAQGEKPWRSLLEEFYGPLTEALAAAADAPQVQEATDEQCDLCGQPMINRWGRYGRFLSCSAYPECKGRRALEDEPVVAEVCPECGAPMTYRRGRFGPFLACTRYPECKGSRPFLKRTGAVCPQCGGDLVERRTRRSRIFYGCGNYPTCNFATWERPVPKPCPECGGLLLARKDEAHCSACSYTTPFSLAELTEV
ncbi:MAG TPA: type I DNA topoisomerase, partial [Dehalococcoidia bacterium]|nr:type I DNA topoisomerase [Dehalococcoidia bacterium]